jgi:hypothetical protein
VAQMPRLSSPLSHQITLNAALKAAANVNGYFVIANISECFFQINFCRFFNMLKNRFLNFKKIQNGQNYFKKMLIEFHTFCLKNKLIF